MKNLILIGCMGCGKTTVGAILAERLGCTCVDTDHEIEVREGRTIPDIFRDDGEPGFRRIEQDTLKALLPAEKLVLATGGGIILDPENVRILRENGIVLYLKRSPESLFEHLEGVTGLPLLDGTEGEDRLARIRTLLQEREALYASAAHQVICCDGKESEEIAEDIYCAISKNS